MKLRRQVDAILGDKKKYTSKHKTNQVGKLFPTIFTTIEIPRNKHRQTKVEGDEKFKLR